MAISYTGQTTIYGPNLVPVLREIFFENQTISSGWVTFNDDMKAGTLITNASISVTAQAYTGAALFEFRHYQRNRPCSNFNQVRIQTNILRRSNSCRPF